MWRKCSGDSYLRPVGDSAQTYVKVCPLKMRRSQIVTNHELVADRATLGAVVDDRVGQAGVAREQLGGCLEDRVCQLVAHEHWKFRLHDFVERAIDIGMAATRADHGRLRTALVGSFAVLCGDFYAWRAARERCLAHLVDSPAVTMRDCEVQAFHCVVARSVFRSGLLDGFSDVLAQASIKQVVCCITAAASGEAEAMPVAPAQEQRAVL